MMDLVSLRTFPIFHISDRFVAEASLLQIIMVPASQVLKKILPPCTVELCSQLLSIRFRSFGELEFVDWKQLLAKI